LTKETEMYAKKTCVYPKTKETYALDKRDLLRRQKGPTRKTKETQTFATEMYPLDKRDSDVWERDIHAPVRQKRLKRMGKRHTRSRPTKQTQMYADEIYWADKRDLVTRQKRRNEH